MNGQGEKERLQNNYVMNGQGEIQNNYVMNGQGGVGGNYVINGQGERLHSEHKNKKIITFRN